MGYEYTARSEEVKPLTTMVDDSELFTVTKGATDPDGEIVAFRVPPSAKEGDDITPGVGIENVGGSSGTFDLEIKDIETNTVEFTGTKTIPAGGTDWIYPGTKPMPDKDWKLIAVIRHNDAVDDYLNKTITLSTEGEITSYDAPSSAVPDTTVTVSATAENLGTVSGTFRLRLIDRDNGEIDSTGWFTLSAGSSSTKSLTGTMPDRDWNLRLNLERELPTGAITLSAFVNFVTENLWRRLTAWWNGLKGWQKALMAATSIGGMVAGALKLKKV